MADDTVRIVFKTEGGPELHSEILTESLSAWLDQGWELAPDFLSDAEVAAAPPAVEYTYEDWYTAGGRPVMEDDVEPAPTEAIVEPAVEPVDETAVTESDQSVVETPEEN